MNLRELPPQQQVKDESRVPPVILLPPLRQSPDLRSVADEHAVAEALDEFDEPGAVAARLDPDDHLAGECGIEPADIISLVIQLMEADLTPGRVAVTNGLLMRLEIHTTIDSYGHLLRGLMRKVTLLQLTSELEVPASSHHCQQNEHLEK
jgi:hypothetical protein